MRTIEFDNGAFYHVYNRGVDRRATFLAEDDYEKFLFFMGRSKHDLNDGKHLVNIHAYTIMSNHFHLLLEQISENGISQFMQRIGTSYTRLFNRKYERSGALFEAAYKIKSVGDDGYLTVIASYIHRNPLSIKGFATVEDLDRYPWSSYRHYRNLIQDDVVDGTTLSTLFGSPTSVKTFHEILFRSG